MKTDMVRYTTTLPIIYIEELKEMTKEKKIPSVNYAIKEALDEYIKSRKAAQYAQMMRDAGRDEAFLERTFKCARDFIAIDIEVSGSW